MTYEDYFQKKNRLNALHRSQVASKSRGGKKCHDCGLYGCVCQMTLPDTFEEIEIKSEHWLDRVGRMNRKKNKHRRRLF